MDDRHTQDALDALADLFLTDSDHAAPASAPKRVPSAAGAAVESDAPGGERSHPIRLPPTLRRAAVVTADRAAAPGVSNDINDPPPTPADVVAHAPRLRLHRPTLAPAPPSRDAARPSIAPRSDAAASSPRPVDSPASIAHVELALLGELPGFAGPWLAQYAYRIAVRRGPVAILRIEPDGIDLDLVAPRPGAEALRDDAEEPHEPLEHAAGILDHPPLTPDARALADLEAWARDHAEGDLIDLLDTLVNFEGAPVRQWIIRPPSLPSDMTVALARKFTHWTILTGAHPAAIAGVERTLRQLHQDGAAVPQSVKVMYLGCDRAQARVTAQHVRQSLQGLLPAPVRFAGAQQKMGPVSLRSLGSFERVDELLPAVVEFFAMLAPAAAPDQSALPPVSDEAVAPAAAEIIAPAAAAPPTPIAAPVSLLGKGATHPDRREHRSQTAAPNSKAAATSAVSPPTPAPTPERVTGKAWAAGTGIIGSPSAIGSRTKDMGLGGSPGDNPIQPSFASAAAAIDADPLDLTQFLDLPGSTALEARAPRSPHVQIVLDQAGVLHLLLHHDTGAPDAGDFRAAVLQLLEARAWVGEHRQLLALTQRQLRFDADALPVPHLFSDDLRSAVALAARLGDQLKLHLLQAVQLDNDSAWYHAAIN